MKPTRVISNRRAMSTAHGATTCETLNAVGIEPFSPVNPNPMMANDFGFYFAKSFELPRRFFSPGVPSSPLESSPVLEIFWRR